ncbi:hypothetical protein [Litchfieldia alkalitelluris]|nr:hypothetical protein [Litchfieldia alkalitelluris]
MEKDEHVKNQVVFITNPAYDSLENSDTLTNEAESQGKSVDQDTIVE